MKKIESMRRGRRADSDILKKREPLLMSEKHNPPKKWSGGGWPPQSLPMSGRKGWEGKGGGGGWNMAGETQSREEKGGGEEIEGWRREGGIGKDHFKIPGCPPVSR